MKKKILIILFTGIITIGLVGCGKENSNFKNNSNNYDNSGNNSSNNFTSNSNTTKNKKYNLGETFIFDGLELKFDDKYSFTTVNNRYSEHNGKSVIKLGVNVKNLSSEKNQLNMFFYKTFGTQGTELDSITAYFDNVVDYAGELKPGASYKTYFYILYDGNGEYSIDFDNYLEEMSVEFNVTK